MHTLANQRKSIGLFSARFFPLPTSGFDHSVYKNCILPDGGSTHHNKNMYHQMYDVSCIQNKKKANK